MDPQIPKYLLQHRKIFLNSLKNSHSKIPIPSTCHIFILSFKNFQVKIKARTKAYNDTTQVYCNSTPKINSIPYFIICANDVHQVSTAMKISQKTSLNSRAVSNSSRHQKHMRHFSIHIQKVSSSLIKKNITTFNNFSEEENGRNERTEKKFPYLCNKHIYLR